MAMRTFNTSSTERWADTRQACRCGRGFVVNVFGMTSITPKQNIPPVISKEQPIWDCNWSSLNLQRRLQPCKFKRYGYLPILQCNYTQLHQRLCEWLIQLKELNTRQVKKASKQTQMGFKVQASILSYQASPASTQKTLWFISNVV